MIPSAALFGRPTNAPGPRNLVQFKAGKMTMNPDNWVHADPRKGWAYLYQAGDGKLHFCWIDRRTGYVEENFTVLPKQAKLKRVAQCSTGRVYVLKLKANKKLFLWMQERHNVSDDDDLCAKVNTFINSPPNLQPSDWLGGLSGLNRLTQSDIMALLSVGAGYGSALSTDSEVPTAQATSTTTSRHLNTSRLDTPIVQAATANSGGSAKGKEKIQLSDLHNLLNFMSPEGASGSGRGGVDLDLNDVLNVKELREFISKPEVQSRLKPHMPVVPDGVEASNDPVLNVTRNLQSSQFKSTLKSFTTALRMGELTPVISQFNLGAKANEAARSGDVIAFAKALQGVTTSVVSAAETNVATASADEKKNEDKSTTDAPEKMDED